MEWKYPHKPSDIYTIVDAASGPTLLCDIHNYCVWTEKQRILDLHNTDSFYLLFLNWNFFVRFQSYSCLERPTCLPASLQQLSAWFWRITLSNISSKGWEIKSFSPFWKFTGDTGASVDIWACWLSFTVAIKSSFNDWWMKSYLLNQHVC